MLKKFATLASLKMFFSFLLFVIIGFIPFVAAFFGLRINLQHMKKLFPSTVITFFAFSLVKLFVFSVALAELEKHSIQSFVFALISNSFEFVAFRYVFTKNKISNIEKGQFISFWWATLSAFVTTILTFISNSRTYELEPHQISYAFSTISYLFMGFTMQKLTFNIQKLKKITELTPMQQIWVLLTGLPNAIVYLFPADSKLPFPDYLPDVLKVASSAVLFVFSRGLSPASESK